jgi:hypothetical protein
MGILDDAIREHLDLKRKHGAHDADLREIEDEAFGSTDRPDPFAANELFNEVSSTGTAAAEAPGAPSAEPAGLGDSEAPDGLSEPDVGGEDPTRLVEPEALRPSEPPSEELPSEPISPPEGLGQIPGQVELPGQDEIPGQERLEDPLEGYQRSTEPEPAPPESDELELGAEPTSPSESLEDLIAEEEPFPEDTAAPAPAPPEDAVEPPAPPEPPAAVEPEEPEEEPAPEPESFVPEPPPPPPDTGPEPPGRARGRVDVPTQEHPPPGDTGGLPPLPPQEPELEPEPLEPADEAPSDEAALPEPEPYADEPPAESGGPALYDFETDEESLTASPAPADDDDDDFEALGPAEEEAPYLDEEEPYAEEPVTGTEPPPEEPGTEVRPALEDEEAYEGGSPDPEETYEEDEGEEGLWFEKGPPKDFDFDE